MKIIRTTVSTEKNIVEDAIFWPKRKMLQSKNYLFMPFSCVHRYLCSVHRCWQHRSNLCSKIYVANIGIYVGNVQMKRALVVLAVGTSSRSSSFTARFYKCSLKVSKARARLDDKIAQLGKGRAPNVRNELDFYPQIIK